MLIQKIKQELNEIGFIYSRNGDYGVTIEFTKYIIYIFETLSGNIFVKVETLRGEKISSRTYKTVKGAMKYIIMTYFSSQDKKH
jgi:hypothetical protein